MARSARKDTNDTSPRNLGRYRLYGEIASGGMATVHFGRQIGSGGFSKMVAIKRLHPQFAKVGEFVEMFLAEARLAARIKHPNVVQPLDVLRVEDEVFLVMEYVEGDSLSRLMKSTVARQEKVPLPVAVALLSGVLRGLHAAHEAKNDKGEPLEIVHRDVSPQNILVGIDGSPRVIDFGIAKAANSIQITREGELKGKLAYISPEILNGHRGTRRADIYAAAVVLWEVLTAQRLFDADYQSAILANILHRPVDPPSDFVSGLPPALDQVVMKGLARDPSDRYATAREMAVALEEATSAASPAVVGDWVEVVAATSLANRGKRVAQIEALSSEEDLDEQAEEVLSEFMSVSTADPGMGMEGAHREPRSRYPASGKDVRSVVPPAPPPPSRLPASGTESRQSAVPPAPPPPSRLPASGDQGRQSAVPPPPSRLPSSTSEAMASTQAQLQGPASPPVQRSRTPTLPSHVVASTLAPPPGSQPAPTIQVTNYEHSAPAWPVPGIAPAAPGTQVQMGPRNRSNGGWIVILILVLAASAAVLYVGLPEFLKRSYAQDAARAGVSLGIDSVQVSYRHVRVLGVTASIAELPGMTLHAQSVDIGYATGYDPSDATMHDVLVNIDGSASSVQEALRRLQLVHDFAALRQGTVRQVAIDAGHLVWTRAFGEGTRFEAENFAVEAERNGHDALGEDLNFASPIVVVTAPWGKLGPWAGNGQVDHKRVKALIQFDPSGAIKTAATFVLDGGHVTSFDMTVPRSNAVQLGMSNALLQRRPDESLFVQAEAHYALRSPAQVEASMRVTLSGARLANAMSGTDASVEGYLDGDPAHPIELTRGVFAYGPFRGVLSGPVTVGDMFLRADLVLRTGAAHCAPGSDVALGGGIGFDTRSLGDARLVVSPNGRCPLNFMPPAP